MTTTTNEVAAAAALGTDLVPGRQCGSCILCCKLLGIKEINKPEYQWCKHCKPGVGCTIYDTRPKACRTFYCGYRQSTDISDAWFPARSRMVLLAQGIGIVCYVDTGYPDAWKVQPYYGDLKTWARRAVNTEHHVIVNIGGRVITILPDSDVDLGFMQAGEKIVVGTADTPMGPVYRAHKVQKGKD